MGTDPAGVEQSLKVSLERVLRVPELSAEMRAQLRGKLEAALREADRRAATKELLAYGRDIATNAFNTTPLVVVGAVYLIITIPLTRLVALLERRNRLVR